MGNPPFPKRVRCDNFRVLDVDVKGMLFVTQQLDKPTLKDHHRKMWQQRRAKLKQIRQSYGRCACGNRAKDECDCDGIDKRGLRKS